MSNRAFTLLELLVVIAIVAVLVGFLLPGLSSARRSAESAQTKIRFAQWAAALEAFRSDYGHYPKLDASALVNGGAVASFDGSHLFHDVLAGRRRDGTLLSATDVAAQQNRRRVAYHRFGAGEFTEERLLADAAGNTSIAVLVDRNLDGFVRISGTDADYETAPAVATVAGASIVPSLGAGEDAFPVEGVRAGVVFYVAAPTASASQPIFLWSWR